MNKLMDRVQQVAELARQPQSASDFNAAYQDLLVELQTAMRLMRSLALVQQRWLQEQAIDGARFN